MQKIKTVKYAFQSFPKRQNVLTQVPQSSILKTEAIANFVN